MSDDSATDQEREEYRADLHWYWRPRPDDGGETKGNPAGAAFDSNPKSLVRETGQNLLDELLEGEQTVEAEYLIIELGPEEATKFLETLDFEVGLRPHLEACALDTSQKHHAAFKNGLKQLEADGHLTLIRISDYNANGLTGPESGEGRFKAVCRNVYDSQKKSTSAGGSYGLGKATMWAASWMSVVVANSMLSEPEGEITDNRLFVRADLPSHQTDRNDPSTERDGPGWYGGLRQKRPGDEVTVSYHGNETLARDLLVARNDDRPGTTFLIVGARDPSGAAEGLEELEEALYTQLAENFWAAMTGRGADPPRLVATVGTQQGLNPPTLRPVQPAATDNTEPLVKTLETFYTGGAVDELEQPGDVVSIQVELEVPERTGEDPHPAFVHNAMLVVAYTALPTNNPCVSRYVYLRGNNMTITDKRLTSLPLGSKQFHAVLLAGRAAGEGEDSERAEAFLRAAEPPSHDRWKGTEELTDDYARGGGAALDRFDRAVKMAIRGAIRNISNPGSDGPDSLGELLRLDNPPEHEPRPKVASVVKDNIDPTTGAATLTVEVTLPKEQQWTFEPALLIGSDSGSDVRVEWLDGSVIPVSGCEFVDGQLRSSAGKKTAGVTKATFKATSDPTSYPVDPMRAKLRVELRKVAGYEGQA